MIGNLKHQKQKRMDKKSRTAAAAPASNGTVEYRENPKTNEKIDAWIKANPDGFKFLNELPHDRAVRKLILNKIERYERLQKMNNGIMQKLESDPEAKQAFDTLLKRLPEDQRERATAQLARHVFKLGTPRNGKAQSTAPGMRMAA
jgi:hypothetical protein